MSDEHHYRGGHELEGLSAGNLFRLVFGLAFVTLLSATAVVQWFYQQRDQLVLDRAAEGSFALEQHRVEMTENLQGIDATARKVVEDPALLRGTAPPAGWVHPDDLKTGAAAPAPGAAGQEEPE